MPSISLFFYYYYYFYSVVCLGESKSLVLFTPFFLFQRERGWWWEGKEKYLDHDMIPAMVPVQPALLCIVPDLSPLPTCLSPPPFARNTNRAVRVAVTVYSATSAVYGYLTYPPNETTFGKKEKKKVMVPVPRQCVYTRVFRFTSSKIDSRIKSRN